MATKKTESEELKNVTSAEDKISVFVPFIEGEDPEVTIWCNDEYIKFKKGYTVAIPRRFAQILENSNQQAITAMENKKKLKSQRQDW